jgi:hypothetical protein
LGEAGANRWVVITRDDRIRYNQLEKQAVLAAKLRFFSITSSSLTGDEAASLILSAVSAMTRLCRQDIEDIRRHAETMACIVVEMYQEQCRDSGQLEELDVEGILAFAERVLPRASDLRVRASLDQRQRFQQLFFPDGISFDGKGFVRPA